MARWLRFILIAETIIVLASVIAMGRRRRTGEPNTVARLLLDDPTPTESLVLYVLLFHVVVGALLFVAWLSARRKARRNGQG
jgi:hypothetical protein